MSLRLRLIGTMVLVLAAVLAAGGLFGHAQSRHVLRAEVASAMDLAAATVRQAVARLDLSPRPHEDLARIVSAFDGSVFVRVELIDIAGRVRAVSRPAVVTEPAPAWFAALYAPPRPPDVLAVPAAPGGNAAFRITGLTAAETAETWRAARVLAAAIAAFFVTAVTAVVVLVDRLLTPLKRLSDTFGRIGSGEYAVRIDPRGPAEFAALAARFNAMAERLEAADARSRRLAGQIAAVQEEERADLARDLHDEVGPFLFAIDVDAAALERAARSGEVPVALVRERIAGIRESTSKARASVRAVLGRLREGVVDRLGFRSAVEDLVAFWAARAPELTFSLRLERQTFGPADPILFGVVREAVSNALRHALPTSIDIVAEVSPDAMITVVVADNGGGLREDRSAGGHGLLGMRERVVAAGGTVEVIDRTDASGVRVVARLPLPAGWDGTVKEEKG